MRRSEPSFAPETSRGPVEPEGAQLRRLEIVSLVEATTLLCLVLIAVPLKHIAGLPLASSILGPVHGLAFLTYIWTVIQTVSGGGWSRGEIVRLIAVAFVPFAGFTNPTFLRRRAAGLEGPTA